jgi:hypothetical protein
MLMQVSRLLVILGQKQQMAQIAKMTIQGMAVITKVILCWASMLISGSSVVGSLEPNSASSLMTAVAFSNRFENDVIFSEMLGDRWR